MGLFSYLSNSYREAQEKANRAKADLDERIEHCSFVDACEILSREMRSASSLPMRTGINNAFNEKLSFTENCIGVSYIYMIKPEEPEIHLLVDLLTV